MIVTAEGDMSRSGEGNLASTMNMTHVLAIVSWRTLLTSKQKSVHIAGYIKQYRDMLCSDMLCNERCSALFPALHLESHALRVTS